MSGSPNDKVIERVLVVEDERHIARLLEFVLSRNGYDVQVVHDGETGIEIFESFQPHAVVLDLVLPGISGAEVLQQLKQTESGQNCRFVVVTGHSYEPQFENSILRLADRHCMKPVAPSALLKALTDISDSDEEERP